MACLTLDKEKGQPILRKGNEYPSSYDDVVKTVSRLEKKVGYFKEPLAIWRHDRGNPYLPRLFSAVGVKRVSPDLQAHEIQCAWLYVAYAPYVDYWGWRWTEEERKHYGTHRKNSFFFDRRMSYQGRWVFWEHDRGSRNPDSLKEQLNAYVAFSEANPELKFNVIYTLTYAREGRSFTKEYTDAKIEERGHFLMTEFNRIRRGKQFSMANYHHIIRDPHKAVPDIDPLGAHFLTPVTGSTFLTLNQLTDRPNE